jgi:hypothetical protein
VTDAEHLENSHKEGVVAGVRFCQSALRDAEDICAWGEKKGMALAFTVVGDLYKKKDWEQKEYFATLNQ